MLSCKRYLTRVTSYLVWITRQEWVREIHPISSIHFQLWIFLWKLYENLLLNVQKKRKALQNWFLWEAQKKGSGKEVEAISYYHHYVLSPESTLSMLLLKFLIFSFDSFFRSRCKILQILMCAMLHRIISRRCIVSTVMFEVYPIFLTLFCLNCKHANVKIEKFISMMQGLGKLAELLVV
jgi:hypothetical protein